jgi:hypothetical protein
MTNKKGSRNLVNQIKEGGSKMTSKAMRAIRFLDKNFGTDETKYKNIEFALVVGAAIIMSIVMLV